jgi:hypothetical protein
MIARPGRFLGCGRLLLGPTVLGTIHEVVSTSLWTTAPLLAGEVMGQVFTTSPTETDRPIVRPISHAGTLPLR